MNDSFINEAAKFRRVRWNRIRERHERRRPERTLLYQLVAEHYPRFTELLSAQGRSLPHYVQREFDDFLKCGILDHGFLRVRCRDCHSERLVAFSCKRRGFCPSCGARRMVESAALLVDEVLPRLPMVAPAHPCARDINAVHACHASGY